MRTSSALIRICEKQKSKIQKQKLLNFKTRTNGVVLHSSISDPLEHIFENDCHGDEGRDTIRAVG